MAASGDAESFPESIPGCCGKSLLWNIHAKYTVAADASQTRPLLGSVVEMGSGHSFLATVDRSLAIPRQVGTVVVAVERVAIGGEGQC